MKSPKGLTGHQWKSPRVYGALMENAQSASIEIAQGFEAVPMKSPKVLRWFKRNRPRGLMSFNVNSPMVSWSFNKSKDLRCEVLQMFK